MWKIVIVLTLSSGNPLQADIGQPKATYAGCMAAIDYRVVDETFTILDSARKLGLNPTEATIKCVKTAK